MILLVLRTAFLFQLLIGAAELLYEFVVENIEKLILLLMLSTFGWVCDYQTLGQFQRVGRLKVFLLAAVALLAVRIGRTWHWSLGLFYLYGMAYTLHIGLPPSSFQEVLLITAAFFLIPEIYKQISARVFENIILATSLLHCVVGTLNMFGVYFPKVTTPNFVNRPLGLLGQETVLGPYLVFALVIAAHRAIEEKRLRPAYLSIAAFNLAIIIATKSAMTAVSLAAAVFVFLVYYKRFAWLIAGLISSGCLIFVLKKESPDLLSFSGRLTPWQDAWGMIKLKPWLGYGTGSWSYSAVKLAEYRFHMNLTSDDRPWKQLHQEILQGLFEMGAIGVGLVSIALWNVLRNSVACVRGADKPQLIYVAGFAVFAADSLGSFPLHLVPHGPIWMYCAYRILKGPTTASFSQARA